MFENNKKNMFLEKQRIIKMAINKMEKIHTSDSNLVIVEKLIFIYHRTNTTA